MDIFVKCLSNSARQCMVDICNETEHTHEVVSELVWDICMVVCGEGNVKGFGIFAL